jgi:hypothetical protein
LTEADYAPAGSYLVDQRVVGATTYHVFDAIDYTSNPAGVALKVLSTNLSGTGTLYIPGAGSYLLLAFGLVPLLARPRRGTALAN